MHKFRNSVNPVLSGKSFNVVYRNSRPRGEVWKKKGCAEIIMSRFTKMSQRIWFFEYHFEGCRSIVTEYWLGKLGKKESARLKRKDGCFGAHLYRFHVNGRKLTSQWQVSYRGILWVEVDLDRLWSVLRDTGKSLDLEVLTGSYCARVGGMQAIRNTIGRPVTTYGIFNWSLNPYHCGCQNTKIGM